MDHFTEYAIFYVAAYNEDDDRIRLANYAARRVNEWARGEVPARDLRPFVLQGENRRDQLVVETNWKDLDASKGFIPNDTDY